jgi:dihydrofolate synthase/folylpolyglutamate synthase
MPDANATLDEWLTRLERLHPQEIDLGLERVGEVAAALDVCTPDARVITVAGTNGKGSVCQFLASILEAAGHRVGLYTSPHLDRFNERIRIDGVEADDASLLAAFARVEHARGDVSLTFFEFTTLAALDLFAAAGVDFIVLEVGLGGRLDATNVIDADVAVVTSVALDHAEWLGSDVDAIAREKAGVARPGRPLIIGETQPTAGLLATAGEIGADCRRAGVDFEQRQYGDGWQWRRGAMAPVDLPLPALGGGYQLDNAATALAALDVLGIDVAAGVVAEGLSRTRIAGRFERHALTTGDSSLEVILDVAHNPAAAASLAQSIGSLNDARTLAVIGLYADKDIDGVVAALADVVDGWFPASLPEPRGALGERVAAAIRQVTRMPIETAAADPVAAFEAARATAGPGERIVVLGSFATVAPVRALLLEDAGKK